MASMWEKAFGALQTALSAVSAAGSIPGVNLIPHVATIATAAGVIKQAIDIGVKVTPYIKAVVKTYAGGIPTEPERLALDAKISELEAKVQEALPPKEAGEPD
jgi:hypothetical protein